jgi:hypothetical protein
MSKRAGERVGDGGWLRRDADAARAPVAAGSGGVIGQWGASSSSFAGSSSRRFSASLGFRRSATARAPSEGYPETMGHGAIGYLPTAGRSGT